MFLSVFKLYSKELELKNLDEAKFKEDDEVTEVFARGMALFEGDGMNSEVNGKSSGQPAATNWKMFCHLFQAYSAYLATIARKLQSKGRTTVKSLQCILQCSECAHSASSVGTLTRKLSAQQFRDMYVSHTEYLVSICFEIEMAFPPSSKEYSIVSACLHSLQSIVASQAVVLSPFLITASKYMRAGVKREPTKSTVASTTFATSVTTFVVSLLCPVVAMPKGKKEKEREGRGKSVGTDPLGTAVGIISVEALPTIVWFLADCGLQLSELQLTPEALHGAWQGLAQWIVAQPASDANSEVNHLLLIRSVSNLQVLCLNQSNATGDVDTLLQEMLEPLNNADLVKAFAIATVEPSSITTHMQHCELLSYVPIIAFQTAMTHGCYDKKNKEYKSLQWSMNLWQRVHSLLVQKPPSEPKMVALFGMRLTCFTRSIGHIVTLLLTQLKQDPSSLTLKQTVVPSVLQSALRLLTSSLLDARCVPAVLKSLCTLQTLFAHCPPDTVHTICETLKGLLQSLFKRCADLPEAARMDVCNISHGCSAQIGHISLSTLTSTNLNACAALLICVTSGAFQVQTHAQRRTFVSKRRDTLRLLVRVLLLRPYENQEENDVGSLRKLVEASAELVEEFKLASNQHIAQLNKANENTVEHAEWLCERIDAVHQAIYSESDVPMIQHCTTSRLCWNGLQILSAAEKTALIENIRADLRTLDPTNYDAVFSVATVKKSTKNKKESTLGTEECPSSEQRRRLGWQFQLWTLLAVWASVSNDYSSNRDSVSAKSSTKDGAISSPLPSQDPLLGNYLTAAMQALRQLDASLLVTSQEEQNENVQVDILNAVNAVVSHGRHLHALLHLSGRLSAQAQLIKTTALLCERTENSIPEIVSMCNDFRTSANVMTVLNGVCSKIEESAVIARFSLPPAASPHLHQVDVFCLLCLVLMHSHESSAQQKYLESIVSNKECHSGYKAEKWTVPASAQDFAAVCKHTYRACSLLQQQQAANNSNSTSCSWDFLPWVCTVASKVLWIAFSDIAGALAWGSFTSAAVKNHLSAIISAEDEQNGATRAMIVSDSVLSRLALLEVQLLRAELYEHVGNLDSTFAYLRDATNSAKLFHSPAVQNMVHLHTIRLWHRTASPKLSNLVADLVAGAQEERIYASNVDLSDETSERVRAAVLSICALFPSVSSGDSEDITDRVVGNTSKILANIRFRHLHRYWDVEAAQQSNAGSEKHGAINCMISPELKSQVSAYLSKTDTVLTAPLFSGSHTAGAQSCDSSMLETLTQTCAFDCIRDLRRRMCLEALHSGGDPLRAFLAGAASCGVAVECWERASAESQSQDSADSNIVTTDGKESRLLGASKLICNSLQNDTESTDAIASRLQGLMKHCQALHSNRNHETGSSSAALSFLCFDRASSSLLLGRFDLQGPLVLALPAAAGAQDLPALLTNWDESQERSKSMLRQGLDVEQAGKLTDAQKRSWWSARQNYDASVESSMCDLQDLLGVWRVMLSCDRAGSVDLSAHCEKALALFVSDKLEVARLLPWLELISSNLASSAGAKAPVSRTMRLSQEEAVTALAQVLADGKCEKASALAEKIIKQVIVLLSARSKPKGTSEASGDSSPPSAHGSAATPFSPVMSATELNSLKVTELRALLKESGLDATGKKQDLVDRLHEHCLSQQSSMTANLKKSPSSSASTTSIVEEDGADEPSARRGHVVLVLDEQLQRLPVETMPCLRGANCSRVPSFALLLKLIEDQRHSSTSPIDDVNGSLRALTLAVSESEQTKKTAAKKGAVTKGKKSKAENEEPNYISPTSTSALFAEEVSWQKVSVDRAWYALDIEGNLPLTRSTLQPFLNEYEGKWDWTGVVASIPPEKTTQSLHESSDLFIFCGHGAGERMCDPFRLRRFASCPASLLWGCSSGALKAHGVHDALGTALYYLLAGAPFLVANLWDVTDKDIDKLCMAYMRSVFPSGEGEAPVDGTRSQQVPVAEALVQCRSVCRMANAVGSAPVLYGIPTLLVENALV